MVAGRVLEEAIGGLPGTGIEGLWITLHSVPSGRALRIDALPQPIAEAQTGPQGSFALARSPTQEGHGLVIAVSLSLDETPLTVRPVEDGNAELVLTLPVDEQLRARLEGGPATGAPPAEVEGPSARP